MRFGESDELEGVDYIRFTGSISTLDGDEEWEMPERQFPFGFQYQPPRPPRPEIRPTPSSAWGRWLP